jgi:serine/threonine protein kinase
MVGSSGPGSATPMRVVAGRYQLNRPIGRGGMGTVWLAHDEVLDRPVAVKEVAYPPVVSEEERAVLEERTMREARAAARLTSPRTTTVHDVVTEDGRPWIVMEYVESQTLRERLDASGPLPPAEVARIGLDLLDALEAAHGMGVIHRDVKPGNVLLDGSGRAWLTDFGIATSASDNTLSEPGVLLGSPSFMAPERARDEESGPYTDLWSLGATLYAAVEGRGPFDRGELMATLMAVTTAPPDPPRRAGALGPVVLDLLVQDPEARATIPQTRAALQQMAVQEERSASTDTPPITPPPMTPPPTQPPPGDERSVPRGESLHRISRSDIAELVAAAGRSVGKSAARAAVAGIVNWQENTAPPASSSRPARPFASPRASERHRRRHPVRWSALVASLIVLGLVLGVALIVVLVVLLAP